MRKSKLFQLGLMAALAVACVAEPKDAPQVTEGEELVAGIENFGTRTLVDEDLQVLWETADQISVFLQTVENRPYELKGEGGVASGTFARTTTPSPSFFASVPYNYGVYPYSEATKIDAEGVITVALPAEQAYAEESFGPGANVMVAASEDKSLKFKNLCGYVGVRLTGDALVESVTLRSNAGEPLAGTALVTVTPDGDPAMELSEEGAVDAVTVTCENPVQLSSEETLFWVVVPPADYVEGFTLTVTYNGGQEFVLEGATSLELQRNTLVKMAPVNIVAPKTLPYVEPFDKASGLGSFSIQDVTLPDALTYIWTHDPSYGAKASAYSKQAYEAESWLVSPPIDLTKETQAALMFDYTFRYGVPESYEDQLYLMIDDGETATRVDIPFMPKTDPNFAWQKGAVDLTQFCGKTIQVAFVYNTIDNYDAQGNLQAPTAEVKNVVFDREAETTIFAPATMTFYVDDSPVALGAYANSGATLTFKSSDETVARVNAKGLVTPVAEGTATITMTAPATGAFLAAEATCVVNVVSKTGETVTLALGSSKQNWGAAESKLYGSGFEATVDDLTIGYFKSSSTSNPVSPNADHIRVYKNSHLSISVADKDIIAVELTCTGTNYCSDMTVSDGSTAKADTKTLKISWSGNVSSFEADAVTSQVRIKEITVTYR